MSKSSLENGKDRNRFGNPALCTMHHQPSAFSPKEPLPRNHYKAKHYKTYKHTTSYPTPSPPLPSPPRRRLMDHPHKRKIWAPPPPPHLLPNPRKSGILPVRSPSSRSICFCVRPRRRKVPSLKIHQIHHRQATIFPARLIASPRCRLSFLVHDAIHNAVSKVMMGSWVPMPLFFHCRAERGVRTLLATRRTHHGISWGSVMTLYLYMLVRMASFAELENVPACHFGISALL